MSEPDIPPQPELLPPALSVLALTNAITQYRAQHEQIAQQLVILDQQRASAVKTQDVLMGAIAALEQVIQNDHDERATAKISYVGGGIAALEQAETESVRPQ